MKPNSCHLGDCLEVMTKIPDHKIDMILCDLPYGTTACHWDTVIPFEPLWAQYRRIIKPGGAIVLTASQPFTSALVMSNPKWFKYEWIWRKSKATQFLDAKKRPLKQHENILIFADSQTKYNPQGLIKKAVPTVNKGDRGNKKQGAGGENYGKATKDAMQEYSGYPMSVHDEDVVMKPTHPTQKPVALFEYLVKTYTDEGDVILDNCAGSGTTGIACINTGRKYILIEQDPEYFQTMKARIEQHRRGHPEQKVQVGKKPPAWWEQ